MIQFTMPKLGHLMEEGMISVWHKKEGERVEKGEILLDVETDKSVIPVESNISGVLYKILVHEGEAVPVNALIAIII
ncbi:MAG: biotin/lipoyl-containing protein [Clostridiales bacterium]|nr:biotin/lipoyl-containing protein [Clostridiales bacterium]